MRRIEVIHTCISPGGRQACGVLLVVHVNQQFSGRDVGRWDLHGEGEGIVYSLRMKGGSE
jgi:hypothetical protein